MGHVCTHYNDTVVEVWDTPRILLGMGGKQESGGLACTVGGACLCLVLTLRSPICGYQAWNAERNPDHPANTLGKMNQRISYCIALKDQ